MTRDPAAPTPGPGVRVTVRGPGAGVAPTRLHLTAGPVLLGRSRQAHVRLPDRAVSAAHARVIVRGDRLVVEDLGSVNGTWLGAERLPPGGPRPLAAGEALRIGPFTVALDLVPAGDGPADAPGDAGTETLALELLRGLLGAGAGPSGAPRLELTGPDGEASVHPLPLDRRLVIGRGPTADLRVEDPELSREHVAVTSTLGGVELEDLGSKNGVRVNGERVAGQVRLGPGDRLALGGTVAVVVDPAAAALAALDDAPAGDAVDPPPPPAARPAGRPLASGRRAGSPGLVALAVVGGLLVAAALLALIRVLG